MKLKIGRRRLWIDLQAIKPAQALSVLIEIKGFENSPSSVEALAQAAGQYLIYQEALGSIGSRISVYLAIPHAAYAGIFTELLGQRVVQRLNMNLLVFEVSREETILWLP